MSNSHRQHSVPVYMCILFGNPYKQSRSQSAWSPPPPSYQTIAQSTSSQELERDKLSHNGSIQQNSTAWRKLRLSSDERSPKHNENREKELRPLIWRPRAFQRSRHELRLVTNGWMNHNYLGCNKIFSGLRSQWRTPASRRAVRASSICTVRILCHSIYSKQFHLGVQLMC